MTTKPDKTILACLEIHSDDGHIERHALDKPSVILGRSPEADIRVDDPGISGRHAKFIRSGNGRWIIKNLDRRGRTFFNNRSIRQRLLNQEDVVYVSSIRIVFRDPSGLSDHPLEQTVYNEGDDACLITTRPVSASVTVTPAANRIQAPYEQASASDESPPAREGGSIQWRKLLRYKWTVVLGFLAVVIPAMGWVWTAGGPKFVAKGKIHVRPIIPRLVFQTEENGSIPFYESYVSTQVDILRSPTVMQRVVSRPEVRKTAWYRDRFLKDERFAVALLTRLIQVGHEPGNEIVDVSFGASDPNEAAAIVNTVLDQYVGYVRETLTQDQDYLYQQLQTEYTSLQKEIEARQKAAAELRKKIGTGTPDALISQKRIRLDETESQLKQIEQDIAVASWQEERLRGQVEAKDGEIGQGTRGGSVPAGFDYDEEWRRLSLALRATKQELETAGKHLGERYPKIVDLKEQVKFLETQLRERERQLKRLQIAPLSGVNPSVGTSGSAADPARELSQLPQRIGLLNYRKKLIQEKLQKQTATFEETFANAQLLAEENEAIRYKKELRDVIRSRLDQKELERKVPGSIAIMMRAAPPNQPEGDRRNKLSLAVLVIGLVAGLGMAHYRASTARVIQEVEDIRPGIDREVLGQLPVMSSSVRDGALDTCPVQSECIRIVRTTLLQRLGADRNSVVLVTSAESGVGKTTVAVMLARSLARCGKRVLLVDADLRRPAIAEHLGISCRPGLSDVLLSGYSTADVIVKTDSVYLDVIPSGDIPSDDYPEVLANGVLAKCVTEWRREYDMVILDTPPVLPVADTRITSQWVDGSILVVREGHCQREAVLDAMHSLGSCGAKILGMVYIGLDKRGYKSSYYGQAGAGYGADHGARA